MDENFAEKPKAKEVKRKIREAVQWVLQEKGLEGLTIREICRHADIAIGTFYKHFEGKDALLNDRYDMIDDFFALKVAPLITSGNEWENLMTFARMYREYFEDRVPYAVGKQILKARLSNPSPKVLSRARPFFDLLDDIFARGQKKGTFSMQLSSSEMSDMMMILLRGYSFNYAVTGKVVMQGQAFEQQMQQWCKAFLC